jgi:glycosyltransferase involved in cell wall biosynthesis
MNYATHLSNDYKGSASTMPPLVTVAMPVFNGGRHLRLAVRSLLAQTFQDWELLVIDDGSTDDALQSLADLDDARIRIIWGEKNFGLPSRLNEGIDLARGRYFARMDADDVAHPNRFRLQVELLESNPSLDLVGGRCLTISETGALRGVLPAQFTHEEICARPWMGFHFPHPTWIGRLEWFRKHRYGSKNVWRIEDQEMLLRSYDTSRFAVLTEFLLAYRIRDRTDWGKLARTRGVLWRAQCRHFLRHRQPVYGALATVGLGLRFGRDVVAFLTQRFRSPAMAAKPANVPQALADEWKEIFAALADD